MIDALEFFSALIVFANSEFQDKARLIFEMFDLNEYNSLVSTEIEFMMACCV
jgi:hypothetical protein